MFLVPFLSTSHIISWFKSLTCIFSILNHEIKLLKDSPSPCRIFQRSGKSFFWGIHVINLDLKAITNWLKLWIELELKCWYHFWAIPVNVEGDTQQKMKSFTFCNCIEVLKIAKCLLRSVVSSYLSKLGNLNFCGNSLPRFLQIGARHPLTQNRYPAPFGTSGQLVWASNPHLVVPYLKTLHLPTCFCLWIWHSQFLQCCREPLP